MCDEYKVYHPCHLILFCVSIAYKEQVIERDFRIRAYMFSNTWKILFNTIRLIWEEKIYSFEIHYGAVTTNLQNQWICIVVDFLLLWHVCYTWRRYSQRLMLRVTQFLHLLQKSLQLRKGIWKNYPVALKLAKYCIALLICFWPNKLYVHT